MDARTGCNSIGGARERSEGKVRGPIELLQAAGAGRMHGDEVFCKVRRCEAIGAPGDRHLMNI